MRRGFTVFIAAVAWTAATVGCRQDMQDQPKMIPGRHSAFFADGRSGRQQVPGTIARGEHFDATYLTTGLENGAEGKDMPYPVTYAVLERGQERFNIYCSPCHSRVGNGNGAIVARGFKAAGDLQSTRLRGAPLGHFFYVMTHGYGAMPNYAAELAPEDRWAIAAYIRALQLSQNAHREDVPDGVRIERMDDLLQNEKRDRDFISRWAADEGEASAPASASVVAHEANPTRKDASAKAPAPKSSSTATATAASAPPDVKPPKEGDAAKGKAIYLENCAVCHQPSRAGMPPVFPSLLGIVDQDGEAKVRSVIRNGIPDARPPMPPHPALTESDIDDLVSFLRTK